MFARALSATRVRSSVNPFALRAISDTLRKCMPYTCPRLFAGQTFTGIQKQALGRVRRAELRNVFGIFFNLFADLSGNKRPAKHVTGVINVQQRPNGFIDEIRGA